MKLCAKYRKWLTRTNIYDKQSNDGVFAALSLPLHMLTFLLMFLSSTQSVESADFVPYPTMTFSGTITPTFNSLSVYWRANISRDEPADIYFRVANGRWQRGYPLWYDVRDGEYRGSIVDLEPGRTYEIRMIVDSHVAQATATTWSEKFPVARTVELPRHSSGMLHITEGGNPDGYVLYTSRCGESATIDVNNEHPHNIRVDASYVIIRGLTLKGATEDAVLITTHEEPHDIIIEQNDISGWGKIATADGHGYDHHAAIRSKRSERSNGVRRVIVQYNRIHHPRADSNAWDETHESYEECILNTRCHPHGPQAVTMWDTGGNHVIRYNEIYSDADHKFNDCIGGGKNNGEIGFPAQDSDIYGNIVAHCWDDGIESEGGNMNVRIWGNYIDQFFHAVAIAPTAKGPLYIWRNVTGQSRGQANGAFASSGRGSFVKLKSSQAGFGGGRVFIFHNTILQQNGMGVGRAFVDWGENNNIELNVVTRNNIFDVQGLCIEDKYLSTMADYDFDLCSSGKNRFALSNEVHMVVGVPIYNSSSSFGLRADSPGFDAGVFLPNFSHGFVGLAPDMGAQEAGAPDMTFGLRGVTASTGHCAL